MTTGSQRAIRVLGFAGSLPEAERPARAAWAALRLLVDVAISF